MIIGAVSAGLTEWSFEDGLAILQRLGIRGIEITCAGFQTNLSFGNPDLLIQNATARREWLAALSRHDLVVTALGIHGRPLAPDPDEARLYDNQFRQACRFAEVIGVSHLTLFAGLPPGGPKDATPNWITTAFPPENAAALEWQWSERVLPYWAEHVPIAEQHGCVLCFEMHPGDVVYNPASLIRLRAELGPSVGCNFDPSHLFWQGIDPLEAVETLGDAIAHVHAKDTRIHGRRCRVNGVLDPTSYSEPANRSWSFRTVGYGHDALFWRDLSAALNGVGYDYVLSIEHEDPFLATERALEEACEVLRPLVAGQPRREHPADRC